MFCIQASSPSGMIAAIETIDRPRESSGLPENTGRISEIAPIEGSRKTR